MKIRDIVVDDTGRHYEILAVWKDEDTLTLSDVATKTVYINVPMKDVTVVEGVRSR